MHGAYIVDADPSEIRLAPSNFPSSAKRYVNLILPCDLSFFPFSIQFENTCKLVVHGLDTIHLCQPIFVKMTDVVRVPRHTHTHKAHF